MNLRTDELEVGGLSQPTGTAKSSSMSSRLLERSMYKRTKHTYSNTNSSSRKASGLTGRERDTSVDSMDSA